MYRSEKDPSHYALRGRGFYGKLSFSGYLVDQ